jgi:hypothetical protein
VEQARKDLGVERFEGTASERAEKRFQEERKKRMEGGEL